MKTIDEITQRLYQLEEEKSEKLSSGIEAPNANDELVKKMQEEKEKSLMLVTKVQDRENRITELERTVTDLTKEIDQVKQQMITQ